MTTMTLFSVLVSVALQTASPAGDAAPPPAAADAPSNNAAPGESPSEDAPPAPPGDSAAEKKDEAFAPTAADDSGAAELDAPADMSLPEPVTAPVVEEPPPPPPPKPERAADKLPPKTKARLLAMDLVNQGIPPAVLAGLNQAMQEQARRTYSGETMTLEQVRLALNAAATQESLGCEASECMVYLGDQVAADIVVGGNVALVGTDYLITILAINTTEGNVIGTEQQKVPTHEDLSYYAVRRLTELALTGESTDPRVPVRITASDQAGLVLDGKTEGSLPQTLLLDAGQHNVEVSGDGYVPWRGTITVKEGEPIELHAELTPRGFPIWPFAMMLGGTGAVFGALWVGVAMYTLEAYNGGFGLLSLVGLQGKNTDYWHVQPADSATLSQKRSQVRLLGIGADFLAGAAILFTVLAIAVHVTDIVLLSLE